MRHIAIFVDPPHYQYVCWLLSKELYNGSRNFDRKILIAPSYGIDASEYRLLVIKSLGALSSHSYTQGMQLSAFVTIGDIPEHTIDFNKGRLRDMEPEGFIYDFKEFFRVKGLECNMFCVNHLLPVYNLTEEEVSMYRMLYPARLK